MTEGDGEFNVSRGLARKVRDLTQRGKLDWLLHRQAGRITEEGRRSSILATDHENREANVHRADRDPSQEDLLGPLLIKTPSVTSAKGSPTLSAYSYNWVVKVRLENLSERVITVGEFALEVSRGEVVHVLPHLAEDVCGSRGGVTMPEETLGTHVSLKTENPLLTGDLRFIDDDPFGPGPVNVNLLIKGIGTFRGAERRHEMGGYEHG